MGFRYDSYCGLYCGACNTLIANMENRVDKLAEILGRPPEELRCNGCKTEINSVYCRDCKLKKCAVATDSNPVPIASKKEGGDWGLKNLPETYREIIKTALGIYSEQPGNAAWDHGLLVDFAGYMLQQIFLLVKRDGELLIYTQI
ncbi:MAG TPA: aminoglycoside adenylyltransferase domain-containing protein [Bacillota bacterium]|jgi:hypothetical protein